MKKVKNFIFLQFALLIYAISNIPSKFASSESFLSFNFCLYYGILLLILALYAILWQQALKMFPLMIAYASKAITIIWSMLIGYFLFKEGISLLNVIGAVIVIIGIIIMVKGEQNNG